MSKVIENWRNLCYHQHDVVCNQKYGGTLPYSFHIECVVAQVKKFIHLISEEVIKNPDNQFSGAEFLSKIVEMAALGHDLIEDARMNYNDILNNCNLGNTTASRILADIIYCVTDEKGKTRKDRKNYLYYEELKKNKLAIFVKLCDISANMLYGKLTNSGMYHKYKSEFPYLKKQLYVEEYELLFNYIENI